MKSTRKEATYLINKAFSKLMGFECGMNSDWKWLVAGVRTGQITPDQAAEKMYKGIIF